MTVKHCIPVVPSADLERTLRLWRDGLGFLDTWWESRDDDGRLTGYGLRKDRMMFMFNIRAGTPVRPDNYEGVRFYWNPGDLHAMRERLIALGYEVSDLWKRDYGQTEFTLVDDDGYDHCFGLPSAEVPDRA